MTRIGTWGADQLYISRLQDIQTRMQTEQNQVATQLVGTEYSDISTGSNLAVTFENEKKQADQFVENNKIVTTRLQAANTAITSVKDSLTTFRSALVQYSGTAPTTPANIAAIQKQAFSTMLDVQSSLNTSIEGQYLFAGARINNQPVDIGSTSLTQFQSTYDGYTTKFPTTRAVDMFQAHLTSTDMGTVTVDSANGAIIPANAAAFTNIPAGTYLSLSGTTSNNNNYTVHNLAVTNASKTPLVENATIGATAFITYSGGNITCGAGNTAGVTSASFDASGNIVLTPGGTAGNIASTAALLPGTKITVGNSPGAAGYNGAYVVVARDPNTGAVTVKNDTDVTKTETISTASLSLTKDAAVVDGIPDTAAPVGAVGNCAFTISGNTVTLTAPTGANLAAQFAPGDPIGISGTADHNGTYVCKTVSATQITFDINPPAIRTSQLLPQTNVAGCQMNFTTAAGVAATMKLGTVPGFTNLSFTPGGAGGETITATPAASFVDPSGSGVPYPTVGTVITLTTPSGANAGNYQVYSNDTTNIILKGVQLTNEAALTAKVDVNTWYKGDTMAVQQRVDTDRAVDVGLYASDPSFEKAMRAMALIAQGVTGTAGGLDKNQSRVQQALWLLQDAIDPPAGANPPFGTEATGDVKSLSNSLGVTLSVIKNKTDKHTLMSSFADTQIASIEKVDTTEAITKLTNDNNALQASYQTMAAVHKYTLLDFIK